MQISSSRKEIPKHSELEVYPFVSFSKAWSMIFQRRVALLWGAFVMPYALKELGTHFL